MLGVDGSKKLAASFPVEERGRLFLGEPTVEPARPPPPRPARGKAAQAALALGALGVVFGDIGTSPLYTIQECVAHGPAAAPVAGILGILSLIFWALIAVVSVKYLAFVMRADNRGEGGIFALLALLHEKTGGSGPAGGRIGGTVVLILAGAALLYGDGIITPAISVLGAAEGLNAINPAFAHWVPGIAIVVLGTLFCFQHKGTQRIGGIFGPIMVVWFATLAALGLKAIAGTPTVLRAIDPRYGLRLLCHDPLQVTALLGAVVLAITGAEALYADMGHFGRRSIGLAWYGVALPALALNYFGQGAYALAHPGAADNPFFALAPAGPTRAFLTGLSILAAIIASQALISGAFSLTRQAIQLGYFPRLTIKYTNVDHSGQIYLPFVNWVLAIGCVITVALFGSTARLASAYGIAVTGTMALTTIAYYLVSRRNWHWSRAKAGVICGTFLVIDLAFFLSNAGKVANGGWYPIVIATGVLIVMHTWKRGRNAVFRQVYGIEPDDDKLIAIAKSTHLARVPGVGVFMAGSAHGAPAALLHFVNSNRCLHRIVLLFSIVTEEVPAVSADEELSVQEIGEGIWRVVAHSGYMQTPDVSELLQRLRDGKPPIKIRSATYFFNREMIMPGGNSGMHEWQKSLYALLYRNARPAKDYYQVPPSQIVEIGLPIQL
jgi:KUP system potassium uptake protein